jgi:hypothetical protein
MAGATVVGELTASPSGSIRFAKATPADDSGIRRLLLTTPMEGAISVSFEREPGYFHGTKIGGSQDEAFVASLDDRLVAMGSCSLRARYINGKPRSTGYLSELRIDASMRGRIGLPKTGFDFFRNHLARAGAGAVFTSISSDNLPAIRLLERGLPGMPRYRFVTEFVTTLIAIPGSDWKRQRLRHAAETRMARRNLGLMRGSESMLSSLVECLNEHSSRQQLATKWTEADLNSLNKNGLPLDQFQLVLDRGKVVACAALWDQRSFRQTRIRGYSQALRWLRPIYNFAAYLTGGRNCPLQARSCRWHLYPRWRPPLVTKTSFPI